MNLTRKHSSAGQAIVEFALIITVLLMIIFLIIEAGQLLWGWITVQNAAREGARYAITGQYDGPDCAVDGEIKFETLCSDLRVASIIDRTQRGLSGLPLNETSGVFEDDNYYNIEVWGVNESGQLQPNFGGIPNAPVIVRVYYRVPIITPLLRPIVESVPVFGQVTMNNESFGSLGSANQGQGVPPPLPEIPTPGVTPSPTFTPSPTPSPTEGPTTTMTPSTTPSPTATVTVCRVNFAAAVQENQNFAFINGEPGSVVEIYNATTGQTLASNSTLAFIPDPDRECDGFVTVDILVANPYAVGDVLIVRSSDGTVNSTIVLAGPPTSTPTTTNTPGATATVVIPPTATPTINPNPHFFLLPTCGFPGTGNTITLNIIGAANWADNKNIEITWDGVGLYTVPSGDINGGVFASLQLPVSTPTHDLSNGPHTVQAKQVLNANKSNIYTLTYKIPCDNATPMPTATATGTPAPADLIVVGPPQPLATPVNAYEPVTYQMVISNTGDIDVNSQFFVDVFFDPSIPISDTTTFIPLTDSVGYMAVSQLAGRTSRVITITTNTGFENMPITHTVYAMVDSIQQINELVETNNISGEHLADYVTPAWTPTPTVTPDPNGNDVIQGLVGEIINGALVGYFRVEVKLWDGTQLLGKKLTDTNGFFSFGNLLPGNYMITACFAEDNVTYQTSTLTISPPYFAFMPNLQPGVCP